MAQNRYQKTYGELDRRQIKNLTNGPGKLCKAMEIDRSLNGADLCGSRLYLAEGEQERPKVIAARRVGVEYAGEAREYLWRFYIKDNSYVSVK